MHQLRLLLCAAVGLALMAFSLFFSEWFWISIQGLGAMGLSEFRLDLRSATACLANGTCDSIPMSRLQGAYPTVSALTFYGHSALALIVVYEVIRRLVTGRAGEGLAKLGYIGAIACLFVAGATGYFFQPEVPVGNASSEGIVAITVMRSWAPVALLVADVLALVTLRLAAVEEVFRAVRLDRSKLSASHRSPNGGRLMSSSGAAAALPRDTASPSPPIVEPPEPRLAERPSQRALSRSSGTLSRSHSALPVAPKSASADALQPNHASDSDPAANVAPSVEELVLLGEGDDNPAIEDAIAQLRIEPLISSLRGPSPDLARSDGGAEIREAISPIPPGASSSSFAALRGKLNFATAEVTLSGTGIDAKREDGMIKVVPWEDVVGVVARRLPPVTPYDGETFVDVVSTSGSTLRILPWTQLAGEDLYSDDNTTERARALVQLVASRCPAASVDPATRSFLGGRGLAAQLPTVDLLALHDERLS